MGLLDYPVSMWGILGRVVVVPSSLLGGRLAISGPSWWAWWRTCCGPWQVWPVLSESDNGYCRTLATLGPSCICQRSALYFWRAHSSGSSSRGGVTFDGGVGYPSAQADAATPLQNLGFRTFLPPSDNVGICHLVIRLCQLSECLLCSGHGFFG